MTAKEALVGVVDDTLVSPESIQCYLPLVGSLNPAESDDLDEHYHTVMSSTRRSRDSAVRQAAGIAEDLARAGWRLSVLPALALPQSLRGPLLDTIRWWADGVAGFLPAPISRTVDEFGADLDDLEGRVARREDLGSRLKRERRRAARK